MAYQTIRYDVDGPIECITLNRPEALNTIVPPMPDEIEAAVNGAVADPAVKVIVVRGAGWACCGTVVWTSGRVGGIRDASDPSHSLTH